MLASELRFARSGLHEPVTVTAEPVSHAQEEGSTVFTPMGAPMTLNPHISMATMQTRASEFGTTPFQLPNEPDRKIQALPEGLNYRIICKRCGRRKQEHNGPACSNFNQKCTWQCCGKCGASLKKHSDHGTAMGYYCLLTPRNGAQPALVEQYKQTMEALLASRKRK